METKIELLERRLEKTESQLQTTERRLECQLHETQQRLQHTERRLRATRIMAFGGVVGALVLALHPEAQAQFAITLTSLQNQINALTPRVTALETKTQFVSVSGGDMFTSAPICSSRAVWALPTVIRPPRLATQSLQSRAKAI